MDRWIEKEREIETAREDNKYDRESDRDSRYYSKKLLVALHLLSSGLYARSNKTRREGN